MKNPRLIMEHVRAVSTRMLTEPDWAAGVVTASQRVTFRALQRNMSRLDTLVANPFIDELDEINKKLQRAGLYLHSTRGKKS